jgi:hypothetical protein
MLNNEQHGKAQQPGRGASSSKHVPQIQEARKSPHGTADECYAASCRHYERTHRSRAGLAPAERSRPKDVAGGGNSAGLPPNDLPPVRGDTVYGAAAIAAFIFGESSKTARRRVYALWDFYGERAGFRKLKGALTLSKRKWQAFLDRD